MNLNSKIRYIIDLYWNELDIPDLYDKYKERVLKVKKANELTPENKIKVLNTFILWLEWLENWMVDKESARNSILVLIKDK